MKPVDKKKNPGLAKLPTAVRINKMGYMKEGGTVKKGEEKYSTMEFGIWKNLPPNHSITNV
jgi:hypothetical protein